MLIKLFKFLIINLEEIGFQDKNEKLLPLVDKIVLTADFVLGKYILYMKNKDFELKEEIVNSLDELLEHISICKNKIYELYKDK